MRRISSVMVVAVMVGAVAGAPMGSTWAAEPAHQTRAPAFRGATVNVIGRQNARRRSHRPGARTLRALHAGRVERLVLADGSTSMVLERQTNEIRGTGATWVGSTRDGRSQLILTAGYDHVFGWQISDNDVTLLVPGPEPFTTEVIRPAPGLEMEITDCGDPDPMSCLRSRPMPSPTPLTKNDVQAKAADDGSVIDVMILYTDGWAAAHPGSQAQTRLQYLIDLANVSYSNSLIGTQLRLVHSAPVAYPDTGTLRDALYAIRDNVGVFANVEADRTTYGADQVTLVRQLVDSGCGLASMIDRYSPERAYAVIHDDFKTDGSGAVCSDFTYAHEVGHNLGCSHDRDNASWARFPYAYGYKAPSGAFRTVMAYGTDCSPCPLVPHFSNPNVTYGGEATGVVQTSPESADNAATISFTRTEMARFRATVYGVTPTPTWTPGGPTATPTATPTADLDSNPDADLDTDLDTGGVDCDPNGNSNSDLDSNPDADLDTDLDTSWAHRHCYPDSDSAFDPYAYPNSGPSHRNADRDTHRRIRARATFAGDDARDIAHDRCRRHAVAFGCVGDEPKLNRTAATVHLPT